VHGRGLIIQTAFFGDVILTTPLIRRACERLGTPVDVVTLPASASVLANNPAVRDRIPYDKHGKDAGIAAFVRLVRLLRRRRYAVAYLAQSSLRSAALAFAAHIPRRIGFRNAPGAFLQTHSVAPRGEPHQVERLLACPSAYAVAVSKETPLHHLLLVSVGDRDIYQANRLLLCAATRTCDARDSDADVGIANLADVFRQRQRHFFADRAMRLDH